VNWSGIQWNKTGTLLFADSLEEVVQLINGGKKIDVGLQSQVLAQASRDKRFAAYQIAKKIPVLDLQNYLDPRTTDGYVITAVRARLAGLKVTAMSSEERETYTPGVPH